MKKTLLLISCTCIMALFAQAQIDKGAIFLGGGIGVSKGKSTYENTTSIPNNTTANPYATSIYPDIGIAIKQNTIVGVNFNYGQERSYDYYNQNSQQFNAYGGGIFMRKYKPLGKNFYLFGEASLGYYHSKYTTTPIANGALQKQEYVYTGTGFNFYPGVSYALSKKFHVEASLYNVISMGYTTTKNSYTNSGTVVSTYKSNGFSLSTTASSSVPLSVGFRFFL